jgi:DNA polymerase I-like protein with 3'-5' exonuclease and polymerase domains
MTYLQRLRSATFSALTVTASGNTVDFEALARTGYESWKRDRPGMVAVDTETEGVAFFDQPFCVTIAWDKDDQDFEGHYFELADFDSRRMVREILMETPSWVFHNAKFDLQKLILAGILDRTDLYPDRFEDTEALAHLYDGNQKKGLKDLAVRVLGINDTVDVEIKSGPNKGTFKKVAREKHELDAVRNKLKLRAEDGYHLLPRDVVIPYAITDTILTLQLYDHFWPLIVAQPALSELYAHEKKLTLVLLDMEAAGMAIDLEYTRATAKEYGKQAVMAELEIRQLSGNEDIKPNSPKQLVEAFARRGVNLDSTGREVLEKIDDPLAAAVLKYRSIGKLHSTYLIPMLEEQRDGIIHPNFRQHGTKTGRMSSGEAEDSG